MAEIIVGVSGGIAAYKTAELVRALKKQGHAVTVAMTKAAKEFIAPLTFAALSGRPVVDDVFRMSDSGAIEHVELGKRAQLIVIAPATADLIARLYAGRADDALTALVLASSCPVLLAPAMESEMWRARTTQRNVKFLREQRFHFIGPDDGALASGRTGMGRMSEPKDIAAACEGFVGSQEFQGKHFVISAGPTREPLDPVRFLTNKSSGKMGFAIAARAAARGAKVTLIAGPVSLATPARTKRVDVQSAQDMLRALQKALPKADALIMAAAVADYTPEKVADKKLKKAKLGEHPVLKLKETPDLLRALAKHKKRTLFVGFAAETNDVAANAQQKLTRKGLDLIVANDVSKPGIGFDSNENAATIYDSNGVVAELEKADKHIIADGILDAIAKRLS